jgi:DNA-binding transcriptional LysR family regulator
MSIRDLRTFLAIADGGSFAAASRSVRRTQSAVTMQIQALEDEFGICLFDRSRRPPVLSESGRAFLPRAREAVEAYDRLYKAAGDALVEGHLRLGVVPSVMTGVMPKALLALRAEYPAVRVELSMGLSKELVQRVERGELDAAIISDFKPAKSGLVWSPFAEEPLVLMAPIDAPVRRAEELIATYPFIRYTRQAWVGELIDTFIKRRRLQVQEAMTLDTLEAITRMVHSGLGVAIIPLRAGDELQTLRVKTVPFAGAPAFRTIGTVHQQSHPKTALISVLLQVLKRIAREEIRPPARERPRRSPGGGALAG